MKCPPGPVKRHAYQYRADKAECCLVGGFHWSDIPKPRADINRYPFLVIYSETGSGPLRAIDLRTLTPVTLFD